MDRNILFICTGNKARSQMGEALMKKHAGHVFNVYSAGTNPGDEVYPPVVEALKEIGIDISGNKPKSIDQFLGNMHFEFVIIVCAEADKNCPVIFGPAQRLSWPFTDPVDFTGSDEDILQSVRGLRDEMEQKIVGWLKEQGIE